MNKFDVIVIGGGPGGYVAAIRAAQLGKKTAIIENEKLGGVCLNWGCIPTKSLLHNANVFDLLKNANKYGIEIGEININWKKMIKRSRDVSKRLSKGVEYLIKKNNIEYISAFAKLKNSSTVIGTTSNGQETEYFAKDIILATGARPNYFDGMKPNGKNIITSKEALILEKQPKSLAIIGAGAIGVEFAHFFHSFGTDVTLIESLPNILPAEDSDISNELEKIFIKRGMKILKGERVNKIESNKSNVTIQLNSGNSHQFELALIAVGVKGNIENLGLDKCKIQTENGWIKVNEYMQTSIKNIYAIGDVAGPPWLAHVASKEGLVASEKIAELDPDPMRYDNIPGCTYCHPEVASVGLTEQKAIEEGYRIKIGKFPFKALGKAMAIGDTEGFVKIIYDEKYGEMLGCHIIGSEATNIITEAVIARNLETTHQTLLDTIHPHPTLSESIMEATADALGEAIHI